ARFNSILLAAPRGRIEDIIKQIKQLDVPTRLQGQATPFALKKANATQVANLLLQFYAQRYPNESQLQNQIRITAEPATNTVFVQAAPADLAEIRTLIERIDKSESSAVNDVKVVRLNVALSDELANLLFQAIQQTATGLGGTGVPRTTGVPGLPTTPGAVPGALPGAFPGAV